CGLCRVLRLSIGDEDREGRVGSRGLDLESTRATSEEATTATELDLAEAGGLDDPVERGCVDGSAPLGVLPSDESFAVSEGDLAEVLHAVVEERDRDRAVIIEDE